jgi:CrcB protein
MKNALLVFLGGGSGSILRYLLSVLIPTAPAGMPWATFVANLSACFLAGLLSGLLGSPERSQWRFLLATGFCGGFSTFSAFGVESVKLMGEGRWGLASLYVAGSLVCCLAGAFAGVAATR